MQSRYHVPVMTHGPAQVVMSTDNLFHRCRHKSHIGHALETSPLAQLDVVGNFISDLGAIIAQAKEEHKRAARAAE